MAFRIGSFNICNFNTVSSNKDREINFSLIADIIEQEQFDIIALQEVIREDAVRRLVSILGTMNWDYRYESPRSFSSNAAEGYAFVWNKRTFCLSSTEENGTKKIFEPRILYQYSQFREKNEIFKLARPPYFGRFTPVNLPNYEIRIINTHIAFNASKGSGLEDFTSGMLRTREFKILAESLYPKMSDKVYGDSKVGKTILLGDYNLNLASSGAQSPYVAEEVVVHERGNNEDRRIITVQKEMTTLKKNIDENDPTASKWANNYDHFTYDKKLHETTELIPRRIDSVRDYCKNDLHEHRKKVSDHVPIQLYIKLK